MACINDLGQNLDRTWSGRSFRTGEIRRFNTLEDYKQYVRSLERQGTYCADITPKYTQGYTPGTNVVPSGFLEFEPRDPVGQSKYSAMSSSWEGREASEHALKTGLYTVDVADKVRTPKPVVPKAKPPPTPTWNCSIQ